MRSLMPIKRFLDLCCSKPAGNIFAIFIIATFLILSLVRTYPFENFQSVLDARGDDWGTYARYAVDIKDNGVLMPSYKIAYHSPAGFLYIYFIAMCLIIFGKNILPIFVAQHLMLGISIALVYWTFRDKMKKLTGILFLCALFLFAFKDVYKNYSSLLLSENLALFTLSVFFFCFVKGFDKNNFMMQLAAAFFLGLSILARPNIAIYALALMPLVAFWYIKKGKRGFIGLIIFILTFLLGASFLFIRNYLVCKKLCFLPSHVLTVNFLILCHPIPPSVDLSKAAVNLLHTKLHLSGDIVNYAEYMLQRPDLFFGYYYKKIIFCLGYLPSLSPYFEMRLRWVLMWAGYFIYLFFRIKDHRKLELWEGAMHLFIFCYYGALVLSGPVESYGFRMLIPALNFVLVFAFMAVDRLWSKIRK